MIKKRTFLAFGSGLESQSINLTNSFSMKNLLPICRSDTKATYVSVLDLFSGDAITPGIITSFATRLPFFDLITSTIII